MGDQQSQDCVGATAAAAVAVLPPLLCSMLHAASCELQQLLLLCW